MGAEGAAGGHMSREMPPSQLPALHPHLSETRELAGALLMSAASSCLDPGDCPKAGILSSPHCGVRDRPSLARVAPTPSHSPELVWAALPGPSVCWHSPQPAPHTPRLGVTLARTGSHPVVGSKLFPVSQSRQGGSVALRSRDTPPAPAGPDEGQVPRLPQGAPCPWPQEPAGHHSA